MQKYCLYFSLGLITFLGAKDIRKDVWETTDYLSDFGIIISCDKGLNTTPLKFFISEPPPFDPKAYQGTKSGDILWLMGRFVPQFAKQILPGITHPFVLVISDGDETFPSECQQGIDINSFINDDRIIHIFAQNCDYGPSQKISLIPIGVDFHTVAYKSSSGGWGEKGSPKAQEAQLKNILKTFRPTGLRKKRAFVDFQLSDTMHGDNKRFLQFGEDRAQIFKKLLRTGLIDYAPWMKRSSLWKKKGEYAFSISPHGNGLDCHRTWEDLVLGCIVIVKTSVLDPLYEGLPVVIVKDWSEITQNNIDIWLERYKDAFTNPSYRKKLTNDYWVNKIKQVAQPYKYKQ